MDKSGFQRASSDNCVGMFGEMLLFSDGWLKLLSIKFFYGKFWNNDKCFMNLLFFTVGFSCVSLKIPDWVKFSCKNHFLFCSCEWRVRNQSTQIDQASTYFRQTLRFDK